MTRRLAPRTLLLGSLLLLAPAATRVGAQQVERPEPFDSAGRVAAITPAIAARLQLVPPAWRITGNYEEARLYAVSDSEYVIVVRRPEGAVERYPINRTYRDWLRARTAELPPSRGSQLAEDLGRGGRIDKATRNTFIAHQALLGLAVYAPAFAIAVADDGAARTATWLLVSGVSFFGASQFAHDFPLTRAQTALSWHAGLHGAAGTGALLYALGGSEEVTAAGVFVGGIAGTAAGLYVGRRVDENTARAAGFGADAALLLAEGTLLASGLESGENRIGRRTRSGLLVAAGAAGYPLGLMYARTAPYNVTGGDLWTLWVSAAVGALAASTFVADGDPSEQAVGAAVTLGGVAGLVAGDRFLVRRYDHTRGEAGMLGLGAGAGALMGAGIYYLIDSDTQHDAVGLGLASVGAMGGLLAAQRLFPPLADQRPGKTKVSLSLPGAAMLAAGVRGPIPLVSVRF